MPTPTATPTPTPEPTATPTPTATATATSTPTPTPEPTATPIPSPTPSPTPEPTATPTATPEPTPTATPRLTATATAEPTATRTPVPVPSPPATPGAGADEAPLVPYLDPGGRFAVGTPPGWRRLGDEEIRAQLGAIDELAAEAALANVVFVLVSPDERAIVALTTVPLSAAEAQSLEAVVAAVQAATAASVVGSDEVAAEPTALDGIEAVRLTYTAVDPATGAVAGRLIRQTVAVADGTAIILSFITGTDDAAAFEGTFRRIEESWWWRPYGRVDPTGMR